MTGKYEIEVYNNRVHFYLEVKRNITIIQGDSATGKSTLIDLISAHQRLEAGSGVTVKCERPCIVLMDIGWEAFLADLHEHIVFVDENMPYIKSKEFADAVNSSDNYFVIIYRDSLSQLSYSLEEIYGMRGSRDSQKFVKAKRIYNSLYNIYEIPEIGEIKPTIVVTEDTNSGNQFFSAVMECDCHPAGGKDKVSDLLENYAEGETILVIFDGAAFGSAMQKYIRTARNSNAKCFLYAPESFEYLILKAGIIDISDAILTETYNYADSKVYLSWERFYTEKLVEITKKTIYEYSKSKLTEAYLTEGNVKKIKNVLPPFFSFRRQD